MALIIDANRGADFKAPLCGHAANILTRVKRKRVKIVVGGKLMKELCKTPFRAVLAEWTRAGRVTRVACEEINAELSSMREAKWKSNDSHVVALARCSGSRLLYTDDSCLIDDFKNKDLLCPRGKIIKTTTRSHIADSLLDKYGYHQSS